MSDKKNYLIQRFSEFNIVVSDEQAEQFLKYYGLLAEWNQVMNLTAITEFEEVVDKHFIDSVLLVRYKELEKTNTLIDIGTGAGFPGIPLKIMYPKIRVLLLDSLNKRIVFLNTVIEELGLTGIEAIHGRAEELARREEYREQFDICVSRAVARLSSLSELCIPYVKIGGSFIPYKSLKTEEELKEASAAITKLGAKLEQVYTDFITEEMTRSLIIIRKTKSTDKRYPRGGGKPIKDPIR